MDREMGIFFLTINGTEKYLNVCQVSQSSLNKDVLENYG